MRFRALFPLPGPNWKKEREVLAMSQCREMKNWKKCPNVRPSQVRTWKSRGLLAYFAWRKTEISVRIALVFCCNHQKWQKNNGCLTEPQNAVDPLYVLDFYHFFHSPSSYPDLFPSCHVLFSTRSGNQTSVKYVYALMFYGIRLDTST